MDLLVLEEKINIGEREIKNRKITNLLYEGLDGEQDGLCGEYFDDGEYFGDGPCVEQPGDEGE